MIGDGIEVTVVDVRGDKVRLGITAPKDVTVHRKEVYEAIVRQNRAAAAMQPKDLPRTATPGLPKETAARSPMLPTSHADSSQTTP